MKIIKLKRFIKRLFGYIPYWECKCKKRCSWFFDSGFIVCVDCDYAKEVYIKKK